MILPVADFNAFHVLGSVFAIWAVLLAFLGIRRANFPSSQGGQRAVIAISLALMAGAVGSGIITAANEEHDTGSHSQEEGTPASDKPPRDQ